MNHISTITLGPTGDAMVRTASLSDLFFHYDHPARDALYRSRGTPTKNVRGRISEEEERAALMTDAADFIATLSNATGLRLEAAELVEDYLARV